MGRSAHVFLATGDDDFAVAIGHGLGRQHHGFQAGTADGVDGQARCALLQATFQHRLAGRILARTGGQHLAHDDFTDQVGAQAAAGQYFFDDVSTEFGGRGFGKAAAEFTDGGTGCCNDDDVFHFLLLGLVGNR